MKKMAIAATVEQKTLRNVKIITDHTGATTAPGCVRNPSINSCIHALTLEDVVGFLASSTVTAGCKSIYKAEYLKCKNNKKILPSPVVGCTSESKGFPVITLILPPPTMQSKGSNETQLHP